MRGSSNICDSDLWEGTTKAEEGHLAEVCFTKAKEEGMVIAINNGKMQTPRQQNHFVMCSLIAPWAVSCFVEVKWVVYMPTILKTTKERNLSFVATHKKNYPELETAKCESAGKWAHSKTCGCMSDEFLGRAKSNHFSALKQSGNDPEECASRMSILGEISFPWHSRVDWRWWQNLQMPLAPHPCLFQWQLWWEGEADR